MKTTVVYHSADMDGLFCREIAKKFLPDAELIGWNFGDPPIPFPNEGTVYVLDLPPDEPFGGVEALTVPFRLDRMVWIDHHATAIRKYDEAPATSDFEAMASSNPLHQLPPTNRQMMTGKLIPGYRIDGVAACRLAWQWFTVVDGNTSFGNVGNSIRAAGVLPMIQDFKARTVNEPRAVRLAGEYDIWDKRDPDAEVFQFGLRSKELSYQDWNELLSDKIVPSSEGTGMDISEGDLLMSSLLQNGYLLQRYQQQTDASVVNHRSFIVEWEGLKFLALTTARCNSLTFAAKDVPETGHDALMGFYFNGKVWTVSLYHAKHRTDLDLSQIAVKHGGGGHRGACGFTSLNLPFALLAPDDGDSDAN